MRDRITGQSGSMRTAALQRTDEVNPEEDGTDAFMRLQTLEQVSSQHQIIANIDEALRAIEKGTYGVCDTCGELISKPRLSVLPFAKNCIKCQSEMENPRRMGGRR
jgi:RNA polymerase-binding transcription factor DksA